MRQDSSPLCCCEYVNAKGERDHILACCCNCSELDACVDNIICCRRRGFGSLAAVCVEIRDKMRIPWIGGARNIEIDKMILPCALTIFVFVLAAQGWTYMVLSLLFLILFITFPQQNFFCFTLDDSFHARVIYSCIAFVFAIYEVYVIPQLEITFAENVVFIILMTMSGFAFYAVHDQKRRSSFDGPMLSKECTTCCRASHHTDFHSVWYWCCIGRCNRKWYLISVGSLASAQFMCSYLTVTTVCRPYELVEDIILVPEDCSDVFFDWRYSICFVCGVFSLLFSMLLFTIFGRELWFISIGLTITEWRSLPTLQKLCMGLCSHRPYNRGLVANWHGTLFPLWL